MILMTVNFSLKPMKSRMKWDNIFQMLKEKNYQLRILYPSKNEEEIKIFSSEEKQREYIARRP